MGLNEMPFGKMSSISWTLWGFGLYLHFDSLLAISFTHEDGMFPSYQIHKYFAHEALHCKLQVRSTESERSIWFRKWNVFIFRLPPRFRANFCKFAIWFMSELLKDLHYSRSSYAQSILVYSFEYSLWSSSWKMFSQIKGCNFSRKQFV